MRPRDTFRRRPLPLVLCTLLLADGGCSTSSNNVLGPHGDTGGRHMVLFATDRSTTPGQLYLALYDFDAGAFRNMRHINFTTRPMHHPVISSDGLVIAFHCDTSGTGNDDIYIYDRARLTVTARPKLNTDSSETEPAFTGDVRRMLFVREWNGHRHIRIYDPVLDSVLVPTGLDTTAAYDDWSPSPDLPGALFAFVSNRNGNPDVFIYSSGTVLDIADLRSTGNDIEPTLTADGRYVCFASDRAGGIGGYDLYLYDLRYGRFVTLTPGVNTVKDERHPSIDGGASIIAFQSNRVTGFGGWDIWNYRVSAGTVTQGPGLSSASDDVEPSIFWP